MHRPPSNLPFAFLLSSRPYLRPSQRSFPSYTTPPHTFNTSLQATLREIVASDLATSTYSPTLASPTVNVSAPPKVYDAYATMYTNSEDRSVTSTYHVSDSTTTLSVPPGWSRAHSLGIPYIALASSLFITITTIVWILSLHSDGQRTTCTICALSMLFISFFWLFCCSVAGRLKPHIQSFALVDPLS